MEGQVNEEREEVKEEEKEREEMKEEEEGKEEENVAMYALHVGPSS